MGKQLHLSDEGIISRAQLLSGDWNPSGDWIFNGSVSLSGGAHFPDNVKATFGNTAESPDMSIYSDGTQGVIDGDVLIHGNHKLHFNHLGKYIQEDWMGNALLVISDGQIRMESNIDFYLTSNTSGYFTAKGALNFDTHDGYINSGNIYFSTGSPASGKSGDILFSPDHSGTPPGQLQFYGGLALFFLETPAPTPVVADGGGDVYIEHDLEVVDGIYFDANTGFFKDGSNNLCLYDANADTITLNNILLADGTKPLTANWDVGAFQITALNFISDVAIGTSPYACTSTTLNTNLNADMLDGKHIGTSGNTVPLLDGTNTWSGLQTFEDILNFNDSNTQIWEDGSGNLSFKDAVAGTRTLKNIGCPVYVYIKALAQAEGNLHLSDGTNWNVSKALIKTIRIVTNSTDWDLWLLQNDNGYVADDANIPKIQLMEAGYNSALIHVDHPFEDEDTSNEVHLYYIDNSGVATADIYIVATELI